MMSRRGVQHRVTVVGPDVELEGELVSCGLVEIHGRVRGNVRVNGRVVVCQEASCVSDIAADSVEIAGLVQGDVRADTLLVLSTGRLRGTAFCRRRLIRKGGVIEPAAAPPVAEVVAAQDSCEAVVGGDTTAPVPCDPAPEMAALPEATAPSLAAEPVLQEQGIPEPVLRESVVPEPVPAAPPPRLRRQQFVVSF